MLIVKCNTCSNTTDGVDGKRRNERDAYLAAQGWIEREENEGRTSHECPECAAKRDLSPRAPSSQRRLPLPRARAR